MINIIFFGTPDFVLPIPQVLLKTKNHKLSAIVTSPDRPVGRHQVLTPSPVKEWALKQNIPVLTPANFNSELINHKLAPLKPDVFVLAAYGRILPSDLLKLPKYGALCIHPSLLPKYRGASPVPATILAGDKVTGVTILKMDAKVDHGPIVSQFDNEIKPGDTAENLLKRLFSQAAEILPAILSTYLEGRINQREQNHHEATFTKTLTREDGYIDLSNPPPTEVIQRMIRAYYPWPGVWTRIGIKNPHFAEALRGRQELGIRERIIKFLPQQKIQVEGGKPMTVKDFLNGYPETKEWISKLFPSNSSHG